MDGLAVLVLLAVAFWFAPLPAWLVRTGLVAAAAFAVGLTVLFLLARYGIHGATFGPMVPVRSGRSRFITTLQGLVHRFSGGLAVATSMRQLAVLLLFSLLIWSSESLVVFLSFRLFDIALPPTAAVVTIVFLTVGTMLPAAPGFIGTYQFFVISALALYGVSANAGLALSIFMNLFAIGIAAAFAAIAMLVRQLPAKKYSLDQG